MRNVLLIVLCSILLLACGVEIAQPGTPLVVSEAPTLTVPATKDALETPTVGHTPTATNQPSPTPHPYNKVWEQNTLPPMGDDLAVLTAYYAPSPPVVYGYLTRYVDNERAIRIALWQIEHFRDQLDRWGPLLGGNYGPDAQYDGEWAGFELDGEIVGRSITVTVDEQGTAYPANIIELTPAQVNLYMLTLMTPEQREERLRMFDAIVAMKTPNDIGRIFCVYPPSAGPLTGELFPLARVLVMDTSSLNDYTGIGGTEGIPLGYRVQIDPDGEITQWLADVPGPLFENLRTGDVARAVFIEDIENDGCQPAVQ